MLVLVPLVGVCRDYQGVWRDDEYDGVLRTIGRNFSYFQDNLSVSGQLEPREASLWVGSASSPGVVRATAWAKFEVMLAAGQMPAWLTQDPGADRLVECEFSLKSRQELTTAYRLYADSEGERNLLDSDDHILF